MKKVGVLAWIGAGTGTGRMVNVAAAAQAPSGLSISHVLEMAKESLTGQLY